MLLYNSTPHSPVVQVEQAHGGRRKRWRFVGSPCQQHRPTPTAYFHARGMWWRRLVTCWAPSTSNRWFSWVVRCRWERNIAYQSKRRALRRRRQKLLRQQPLHAASLAFRTICTVQVWSSVLNHCTQRMDFPEPVTSWLIQVFSVPFLSRLLRCYLVVLFVSRFRP